MAVMSGPGRDLERYSPQTTVQISAKGPSRCHHHAEPKSNLLSLNEGSGSDHGILIGGVRPWRLHDTEIELPMELEEVDSHFLLGPEILGEVIRDRSRITDDNQLLAYGYVRLAHADDDTMSEANLALLQWYANGLAPPVEAEEP